VEQPLLLLLQPTIRSAIHRDSRQIEVQVTIKNQSFKAVAIYQGQLHKWAHEVCYIYTVKHWSKGPKKLPDNFVKNITGSVSCRVYNVRSHVV
jgi:hypothetical protein